MSTPNPYAAQRCDRCSARALVHVTFSTGDLDFCGHHWDAIAEGASFLALLVQDSRVTERTREHAAA